MAYIGVSPSNGVRRVYDYTATAGQTSFSGSDNNSQTLSYRDSAYIDVYQNGVLLIPSDYTATTGTSVVLDTGATVSDSVQIVVYDVFSVADTVSKANGGTFESNISIGGTLDVTGAITSSAGATITTADNTDTLTLKSTDADANTGPTLFMQRDSASPADGDSIGKISFVADNDAGEATRFARIDNQISDASDGTEDALMFITTMVGGTELSRMTLQPTEAVFNEEGADLDFRVEGDTNTHALFVQAGSNGVGINCDSPNSFNQYADNLVVGTTSGENGITIASGSGNSGRFVFSDNTTSSADAFVGAMEYSHSSDFFAFYIAGNQRVIFASDGDITTTSGSYGTISDEKLKENISDASSQWDDIKALQVRKYSMKADNLDSADKIGVIAQELEKSGMNGLVSETPLADPDDITKKETVKSVKYSILYMKAIKALQEAMTRIETLEADVKALKG